MLLLLWDECDVAVIEMWDFDERKMAGNEGEQKKATKNEKEIGFVVPHTNSFGHTFRFLSNFNFSFFNSPFNLLAIPFASSSNLISPLCWTT